jgi:hypothetical protein
MVLLSLSLFMTANRCQLTEALIYALNALAKLHP